MEEGRGEGGYILDDFYRTFDVEERRDGNMGLRGGIIERFEYV